MKNSLLSATRFFDDGKPEKVRDLLRSLPLVQGERAERLVAVGLWKRLVSNSDGTASPFLASPSQALALLDRLAAAVADRNFVPDAYEALAALEELFGPVEAAAIIASTIWDRVLETNSSFFISVFEVFFRAGGERCLSAMQAFLSKRKDYVPDCWDIVLLMRSVPTQSNENCGVLIQQLLQNSGRADLVALFDVYLRQIKQVPIDEIAAAASALKVPSQRLAVAMHMTGMAYTKDELPIVVALFPSLVSESDDRATLIAFMQARLAVAEHRWREAVEYVDMIRADHRLSHAADLLRALALARLDQTKKSGMVLDGLITNPGAHTIHRAKAVHLRVTTELLARRLPLPEDAEPKLSLLPPSEPVAQSLWVGPNLRWIEQLCIKSYIKSGWRFHLYVYEEPQNVPSGCELHDAASIIPRDEFFFEGNASGVHRGSVGAFSDLFRYRLLAMRGGLWTDTDVINFETYDPSNRRFVCTDFADAGMVTVNGAVMAAPAGDEFVVRAYERALTLLSGGEMYFTRIGPQLLAEIIFDMGADKFVMMPPKFLGPLGPMNAAMLFQPFDLIAARPDFQQLTNIHAYTEIYRLFGFPVDRPPNPQTFLGRLYMDHFADAGWPVKAIRS